MSTARFVYVTYIRTTPEKLWQALLKPEFTRQFWMGVSLESDWKQGSSWKMNYPEGRVGPCGEISGEVLEIIPRKKLVLKWVSPGYKDEGPGRMTYDLEEKGDTVKLTVIHENPKPGSKMIESVSGGWPL